MGRQLLQRRRLHVFPGGRGERTLEKMPFVERLLVYSTKPIDAVVNQTNTLIISTPEELLNHKLLLSNQKSHPIGHERPTISIANGHLFIDCTEKQALTLGCTFARMTKYSGRNGLRRAHFVINVNKHRLHNRFSFVVEQLLSQYGPFECRVPVVGVPVEMEHGLNINSTDMPTDPQDIVRWAGLTSLHVKQPSDSYRPIHVYTITDALVEKEQILNLLQQDGVLLIVGISAKCAFAYTDQKIPAIADTPPPTFFISKKHSINYI